MNKDSKIYVAGHGGLLGSAVVRRLKASGYSNIICVPRSEVDLLNQGQTFQFLADEKPTCVLLTAARVGGIQANIQAPAEFLYENLQIQNNVIEGSRLADVEKLLFTASSCIYPKSAPNPLKVESLMTSPLEPTNMGYALAKLTGIAACSLYQQQYGCNFFSVIPCNLFGPGDNYDPVTSHLLPALIHKIHTAMRNNHKSITLWGSGTPRREFMLSDDCADAIVFLLENYVGSEPINIGTGVDHTIFELAQLVAKTLNYDGSFDFDRTKPDGMMQKLVDSNKLRNLGWDRVSPMQEAIEITYREYLKS